MGSGMMPRSVERQGAKPPSGARKAARPPGFNRRSKLPETQAPCPWKGLPAPVLTGAAPLARQR